MTLPEIDWPTEIKDSWQGLALQIVCRLFLDAQLAFKVVMGLNNKFKFVFRTRFDFNVARSILRSQNCAY